MTNKRDLIYPTSSSHRRFKQPVQGLSLELPSSQDDDQTNMTGLAGKFLVDVQRFLACRKVLGQEHLVTPSLGPELKQVVGMVKIFSARSNLMFRSNAALRTVGIRSQTCDMYSILLRVSIVSPLGSYFN